MLCSGVQKISESFIQLNEEYTIELNFEKLNEHLSSENDGLTGVFQKTKNFIQNFDSQFEKLVLPLCYVIRDDLSKIKTIHKLHVKFEFIGSFNPNSFEDVFQVMPEN